MAILVTGADGYVGFPTTLKLAKEFPEERIIAVDNLGRREWVEDVGSVSATPIKGAEKRFQEANDEYGNISFVKGDLTDRSFVDQLIDTYEPHTVFHLAAQPSAPYSQINGERANFTQKNNNESTRHIIWSVEESDVGSHLVVSTTMGVYGAPEFPIPEGSFEVEYNDGEDEISFPGMAGSWYHNSKSIDMNNIRLAASQFDIDISDFRMGIVYGTQTQELEKTDLNTRFDFDYYFGTVINRFCAQAVSEYPITVYGKGEQRKPIIGLKDTVKSFVNAVGEGDGLQVYNQTTAPVSIKRIGEAIADEAQSRGFDTEVKHYENPRDEKEDHKMEVENERFMNLLGDQEQDVEEGIGDVIKSISSQSERIKTYDDRFIPGVLD